MFHLYKKKPPKDNKTLPNKDPKIAPISTGLLLSDCCISATVCVVTEFVEVVATFGFDDADGGDGGGGGGGDDGDGGVDERSKVFIHIYSSLSLISSNKISLSIDWS